MTMTGRWSALILVALCLLGPAAIGTSAAAGQGAESEYDLDLPGSDDTTPTAGTAPKDDSSGDSDDGFPVLAIVLFGAAGVGVGLALWRLRTRQAYDRASFDAEDEDR